METSKISLLVFLSLKLKWDFKPVEKKFIFSPAFSKNSKPSNYLRWRSLEKCFEKFYQILLLNFDSQCVKEVSTEWQKV